MNTETIFRVCHMPLADVLARRAADPEPTELIEYAIDYSETQEDFRSYRLARRCAMKRAKECFWGTARIYEVTKNERGEEVEAPSFQEFGKSWKKPERIETN